MIPKIGQTTGWLKDTPLEIRVYGTAPGELIVYDDDGISFNYENNEYTTKNIRAENGNGSIEELHHSSSWCYGDIQWKFMSPN